ncbi:MAG: sigma-54-dependent Fis family transcriptional regulator [Verrucomicrobia bacterium]|nr:sigma-54-dependent Fis family transcriptional regulator [Verrucomicrobiota bacterium]
MNRKPVNLRGAAILVVDDTDANRAVLCQLLDSQGYAVAAAPSGEIALKLVQSDPPELILLDVIMPGLGGFETCRRLKQDPSTAHIPVIFITAQNETRSVVEGFRSGGVDYITKPFQEEEVFIRIETHLKNHRLTRALQQEVERRERAETALKKADQQLSILSEQEARRWGVSGFIGQGPAFSEVLNAIRKLQPFSNTNVLILGESGVGKELIARAIHCGGATAKGPFIAVNCSAIPKELGESAFFGHVKGAFSGATSDHPGYFVQADGGTLFLDEVGDMPLDLQAKLLRVIEDGVIEPVGSSTRRKKVEVRILAGTNAELQSHIQAGEFRKDLYFRLAAYTIEVPPLRKRREDIPLLTKYFLNRLSDEMGMPAPEFSAEALAKLESYDFPGNVRELKNLIERALIESGGGPITSEHLRIWSSPVDTAALETDPGAAHGDSPQKRISRFAAGSDEDRVLRYVEANGRISNPECRHLLNVGIHRACYILRKLTETGDLQRTNVGKATEYRQR